MLEDILEKEAEKIDTEVKNLEEITKFIVASKDKTSFVEIEFNGKVWKIAWNFISTREKLARHINAGDKDEIIKRMLECMKRQKDYEVVELKAADFSKNKVNAEEKSIDKAIPIFSFYPKTPKYIASGIFAVRNPETGTLNYSFHRMCYLGKNKFSVRIIPGRHTATALEKSDTNLDCVVFLGVHPAVEVASATSLGYGENEMRFANALMDAKLSCTDIKGIHVPSHANIVMVGKIRKDERAKEGPFLDLTGTWDVVREEPVLEVKEIYYKENPTYRVILPGGREHKLLMGVPQEPRIYKIISNTLPRVKNVVLTQAGGCWLHGVVSIKKKNEGEGKNVGLAALAAHPSMKRVVIVDDDIDITKTQEVEWAIATRVQASKDIIIIPDAKGSSLDPSQNFETKTTDKWIIDATAPAGKLEEFKKVDLSDWNGAD